MGKKTNEYIRADIAAALVKAAKELLEDYENERKAWTDEAYDFTRPLVDNMKASLERYYEATKDK